MNKTHLPIFAVLVIVLAAVGYMLAGGASPKELTKDEVDGKFNCDRVTADVLSTDIYCYNHHFYNEDVENNTVVSDGDFTRYNELFDERIE